MDTSLLVVAAALPSIDFFDEGDTIEQASIEALAIEDADFDFGHVQPTGVFRGVMNPKTSVDCVENSGYIEKTISR